MSRPRNISDQRILDEARSCFLEQGAGVPTQVIAERLGVSHAVLFQRFGTKEQLMLAALSPGEAPEWLGKVQAGPDDRAIDAQLRELGDEIHSFLDRTIPCVAVLRSAGISPQMMEGKPENRPPIKARREVADWFRRAIAAGRVRAIRPEHAADMFLGALQVRPFHHHVSGKAYSRADTSAYIEFAVEVLWSSLKPKEGEQS